MRPADGEAWIRSERLELELDLLVRWLDRQGRSPRPGSYVPHLDIVFSLTGAAGELGSGKLQFRLSSAGPSYGT